jgi:SET domain-containing protein
MNHAKRDAANVAWRKQRRGPRRAMHFYTTRPVRAGEELCFDYGEEYWAALQEVPL